MVNRKEKEALDIMEKPVFRVENYEQVNIYSLTN